MRVQDLMKALMGFPAESKIELSKVLSIDPATEEGYELHLDAPIIGLAVRAEDDGDVLLVVQHNEDLATFGKFVKLKEVGNEETSNGK